MCVGSCAVVHCSVFSLQLDDEQRAVLGRFSTQISTDIKMFLKRLLIACDAVRQMSDPPQSLVSRRSLVPLHERVVGLFVAADQLDFVSRTF